MGAYDYSSGVRVGGSGCDGDVWVSDSSVVCAASGGEVLPSVESVKEPESGMVPSSAVATATVGPVPLRTAMS